MDETTKVTRQDIKRVRKNSQSMRITRPEISSAKKSQAPGLYTLIPPNPEVD